MGEYHVNHNGSWHTVDVHPASSGGGSGGGVNGLVSFAIWMIVIGAVLSLFSGGEKNDSPGSQVVDSAEPLPILSPRSNAYAVPASLRDRGLVPGSSQAAPAKPASILPSAPVAPIPEPTAKSEPAKSPDEDQPVFDLGSSGRVPDLVYELVREKRTVQFKVMLNSVGVQYGPFLAPKGWGFRAEFSPSFGHVLSMSARRISGVHSTGGTSYITEKDATRFRVTPLSNDFSFLLTFTRGD